MHMLLAASLLILCVSPRTEAAFSHVADWKLDSIQQNYAGTWCFHPVAKPAPVRACKNATLTTLLDVHINNNHGPGLSVAYYDLVDGTVFGGAGWANWDAVALPVGVCLSGAVDATPNTYSTTCRFTVADNDHDSASAHIEECTVARSQLRVTDGCYTPPPVRSGFRLDDSTSGILTILGLLIALPGILFGAYRWYRVHRARLQVRVEDGQPIPSVSVGGSGATVTEVQPLQELHRSPV